MEQQPFFFYIGRLVLGTVAACMRSGRSVSYCGHGALGGPAALSVPVGSPPSAA